jgi:hypothetical protein
MSLKNRLYDGLTDLGKNLTTIACMTTLAGCLYFSGGGTNLPGLNDQTYKGLEKKSNLQQEEIYQTGEESNQIYSNDGNIIYPNEMISDLPNTYKENIKDLAYG